MNRLEGKPTGIKDRSGRAVGYTGRWEETDSVWQDALDQSAGGREVHKNQKKGLEGALGQ